MQLGYAVACCTGHASLIFSWP